jgi:lipopolysaccharide transport system ATP-binding protein
MYVRLAFAVAAHLESEILIVDEVLAVGDAEFQKKCLGKMGEVSQQQGRTVLFVSHSMEAIQRLCGSCLLLRNGTLYKKGHTGEVVNAYIDQNKYLNSPEINYNGDRPQIIKVDVNPYSISNGYLQCAIKFKSPFLLAKLNIGLVFKSANGAPIFGTNFKLHRGDMHFGDCHSGVAEVIVNELNLLSGTYSLSVYLGDQTQDYDQKIDHVYFDFISKHLMVENYDINIIGPLSVDARWSLKVDY